MNTEAEYEGVLKLIAELGRELGIALEMSCEADELRRVWPDAIKALKDARDALEREGEPVHDAMLNVIRLAEQG